MTTYLKKGKKEKTEYFSPAENITAPRFATVHLTQVKPISFRSSLSHCHSPICLCFRYMKASFLGGGFVRCCVQL